MKKVLFLLLAAVLLAGCRSRYVITLNNRSQVVAATRPELKGGAYVFKDTQGKEQMVAAGRVAEIAPASMVEKDKFKNSSGH